MSTGESEIKIVLVERQGDGGRELQYIQLPGEKKIVKIENNQSNVRFRSFKELLSSIFLPQGYPSSVSADYLEYQIWDTVQAFASSLSGSLSTRAVLEGVGVGSSTSTPLAATLMWLIKDGTGMVGRIIFAWCNGTKLDADSKKWRFFADVLNDCALTLELCAPYALATIGGSSSAMTGILCLAGVAKSIVGVAGGATRAALTQHQARQGNLADVSAKDGSQETLVNLAALITSLWLLPLLDASHKMTWLAFLIFTILHIFANYQAVKAVTMQTLNRTRFLYLLKEFVSTGKVLSVKDANQLEPVIMGLIPTEEEMCGYSVSIGVPVKSVTGLDTVLSDYSKRNYCLISDESSKNVNIILRKECTAEEMLEAYSRVVMAALLAPGNVNSILKTDTWISLRQALVEQGWNLEHALLAPGEWRASW